jgi:hypothetical protein
MANAIFFPLAFDAVFPRARFSAVIFLSAAFVIVVFVVFATVVFATVVFATVLVVVVIAIEEWMEVTHALSPPERLSFALCECACNFYQHP